MSLVNVAWREDLTWNRQIASVAAHLGIPLFAIDPVGMGMSDDLLIRRVAESQRYVEWFSSVYLEESNPITVENTIDAITAFTLTIVDGNSRYDQWLLGDVELSESEMRGMSLFYADKLRCGQCHGGLFFDTPVASGDVRHGYFNTGMYNVGGEGDYPTTAQGLIATTGNPNDMGHFRVPTLRNLSMTKPWLHDGTEFVLENLLDAYARGGRLIESGPNAGDGRDNRYKSELITGFEMTVAERDELIACLMTLNDESMATIERLQTPFCQRRAGEVINAPCEEPFVVE